MQIWRRKPPDEGALWSVSENLPDSELFRLKTGSAAMLLILPPQCCSGFKWDSSWLLHLKCAESLNHSRFGFDPQLVLTSLPLCCFMISIPVEENILIGLSRCITSSSRCLSSPDGGSRDGERLLHDEATASSLEICKVVGEKTYFYFLFAFSFICFWGLHVEVSCIHPLEFHGSLYKQLAFIHH